MINQYWLSVADRLRICTVAGVALLASAAQAYCDTMLIDDFSGATLTSPLGTQWRGVSDQVMGGISKASISLDTIDGHHCVRLQGEVRLENNGGFVQASLNLAPEGAVLDASEYTGVRLVVRGNGEDYSVHLRTPDNVRPWQSYRAHFKTTSDWKIIELPFKNFAPYRLEVPLNIKRLRRLGLVAIGRAFTADLAVAEVGLYR